MHVRCSKAVVWLSLAIPLQLVRAYKMQPANMAEPLAEDWLQLARAYKMQHSARLGLLHFARTHKMQSLQSFHNTTSTLYGKR